NYVYNINIDMIGVNIGKEIAVTTGENSIVDYITYLTYEMGIGCASSQGVYSSDSTPFADKGIPATSFARISPECGAKIHSRKDVINYLSPKAFNSTLSIIFAYLERIEKAACFPIPRKIPENMKKELDYYLLREERPNLK
ncbi:MAG: M28 family peptidase, partial [Bacilli bacterium]|nr:M28 family peptidase [Bacilli bacterium]